ncbi:MAG: tyrosine-type recombinase/integrase [Planctomyces sp.]
MIFALCRFGGLRCPSEVLALRWEDTAWQAKRFTVRSPKTEHHEGKGSRIVPLFPELAAVLTEGFDVALQAIEAAGSGNTAGTVCGPVITRYRDSTKNLRTTFGKILTRAGLKPWPKLLQNLRSTRETELAEEFPLQAVTSWLGNSQLVAAKHYLQLRDEHFERAAAGPTGGPKTGPQTGPQAFAGKTTQAKRKAKTRENTGVFRGSADLFASLRLARMGDEGLEPPTSSL